MPKLKETNLIACKAYDLLAEKYHELFKDELDQKKYDQQLLDTYAHYFSPSSIINDVGCWPSAHIGKYRFDKGLNVIVIARDDNPEMTSKRMDMAAL